MKLGLQQMLLVTGMVFAFGVWAGWSVFTDRSVEAQEGGSTLPVPRVVNLRAGTPRDCPDPQLTHFGCEDLDNDDVNETPVACRTGAKYEVPPGYQLKFSDIMTMGTDYTYIWSNLRGVVLRILGEKQIVFTSPLVFRSYEIVCIGTSPNVWASVNGRLEPEDTAATYGLFGVPAAYVPSVPALGEVGLIGGAVVFGVTMGWVFWRRRPDDDTRAG